MSVRKTMIALAAATVALALPAAAQARTATCTLTNASGKFRAPCKFVPEPGGSFSIEPLKTGALGPDGTLITVSIVEPGVAEVSGLAPGGNNSRWGSATRSKTNRACWKGADFEICAN